MVLATPRVHYSEGKTVILHPSAILHYLMLLITTGVGGGYSGGRGGGSGGWILLAEASGIGGGGSLSGSSRSIVGGGGGGFWSSAVPSNVGIAIAVTAMAGIALAATLVYSRRGSLKSPWSRRRRKHALLAKQWRNLFMPDGRLCDGGVKFLKKVRRGGVDPTIRAEVWPFLLGVYDVTSSKEERDSVRSQNRKEYEDLRKQCRQILKRKSKENSKDSNSNHKYSGDFSQKLDPATEDVSSVKRSPSPERQAPLSGNLEHRIDDQAPLNRESSPERQAPLNGNIEHSVGDQAPLKREHWPGKQAPLPENIECPTGAEASLKTAASSQRQAPLPGNIEQPVGAEAPLKRAPSPQRQARLPGNIKHSAGDQASLKRAPSAEKQAPLPKYVEQHSAGGEALLERAAASLECEGSSICSQDCSTSDQAIQLSKTVAEGDTETSALTCEDASAGDSDSSDSDTSEETEAVQPFLASGEIEGSDLSEIIEGNSSITETESKSKTHSDEDFATWQRIIRLDALRANSDWIVYSPSQASVSEMKARCLADSVGLKDYEHLEACRVFHAARLVAILEAYSLFDPEIGYCQGMSDLLSPIISVIEEDDEAFWCFVGFMKKARHNFRLDEVGIRRQLSIVSKIIKCKDSHLYSHLEKLQAEDCFFVYRMVVVLFRRELNFEQTLCLWEVMWADQAAIRAGIAKSAWGRMRLRAPPTDDLLLYAIAACVLQRKKLIIEKYSSMEEIMRECNSMAGHLDVWKLLDDAHDLVVTLHDKI